jgi:hypothetical protein
MADDTAALLQHIEIEEADIFGYIGGGVAGDLVGLLSSQLAVLSGTTYVGLVERTSWLLSMIGEFLDVPMPEAELSTDISETR